MSPSDAAVPPPDPAPPAPDATVEMVTEVPAPTAVPLDRAPARGPIVMVAVAVVALLAGGALFLSGYTLGLRSAGEPGTPSDAQSAFVPFWDTYHTITERYAGGDIDRDALVQGAIRGMIDALGDPYSSYLTSDEYRSTLQDIGGQFEGIGAEVSARTDGGTEECAPLGGACRLVVVAPVVGSPAEKAGLLAGDVVTGADDASFDGLSVDEAIARLRGPKGTTVTLTIVRAGAAPFPLAIVRDVVRQQEVVTRELADGRVGYLRLTGFSDDGARELHDALAAAIEAGKDRLILDLRGNPGGYVTAARSVASQFIGSGVLFWEQDASGAQVATDAESGGVATDPSIRVVALIDGGSASASEIVAGALQDSGRATLVGQRSFGKGTVQQWQELSGEGGAFRLTVARWLTPAKRWIHETGIEPDVVVDAPATVDDDPTIDRAVEILGGTGRAVLVPAA